MSRTAHHDEQCTARFTATIAARMRPRARASALQQPFTRQRQRIIRAGAMMLIAENAEYSGLLSGGCLEGHLAELGRELEIGQSKRVRYDMHGPDDPLFGLGSDRERSMDLRHYRD